MAWNNRVGATEGVGSAWLGGRRLHGCKRPPHRHRLRNPHSLQCDRWEGAVEQGKVYLISKASLRNKRGNFNQVAGWLAGLGCGWAAGWLMGGLTGLAGLSSPTHHPPTHPPSAPSSPHFPLPAARRGTSTRSTWRTTTPTHPLISSLPCPTSPPPSQTRHQFEIHLETSSVVELCPDEEDIPFLYFNVRLSGKKGVAGAARDCCASGD